MRSQLFLISILDEKDRGNHKDDALTTFTSFMPMFNIRKNDRIHGRILLV